MWNSPNKTSEAGKQYSPAELSAFVFPIDELRAMARLRPVDQMVDEKILVRMDWNELIYAVYQTLEALLEPIPVPEKGHPGIQEAVVAELLHQAFENVCSELEDEEWVHPSRQDAWTSIDRLLIRSNSLEVDVSWLFEEVGMDPSASQPHLSEKLTRDVWERLIVEEGGLWSEFLWDDDWRIDSIMDLPPEQAESLTQLAGMDLDVVQALPHTPSESELEAAEEYLAHFIRSSDDPENGFE